MKTLSLFLIVATCVSMKSSAGQINDFTKPFQTNIKGQMVGTNNYSCSLDLNLEHKALNEITMTFGPANTCLTGLSSFVNKTTSYNTDISSNQIELTDKTPNNWWVFSIALDEKFDAFVAVYQWAQLSGAPNVIFSASTDAQE